jgi:dienelactone hydrolase
MSLISELKRRKVFRAAAGYVIVAWVLIQVVETIFPAFGLDDAAFRLLVIVLAIGFIPVVILSWALELTRDGLVADRGAAAAPKDSLSVSAVLRRPRFAVPLGVAAVAAIGAIAVLTLQLQNLKAARREMLPQIETYIADGDIGSAYALALEAEKYLPEDPVLRELFDRIAVTMSFVTEPPGAEVSYRRYTPGVTDWISLGATPIESVRLPRAVLHWKLEKPGFETAERAGESFNGTYRINLAEGVLANDELRVPTSKRYFLLTGYVLRFYDVPAFKADRFEVRNEEYLEFVEAGGYENPGYWDHLELRMDLRVLPFELAMDQFRDKTGRFGPATWEGGRYPDGEAQYPVTGISWFEAAAYARFVGKSLPSIHHWSSMTIFPAREEIELGVDYNPGYGLFRSEMAAMSNFSEMGIAMAGENKGLAPFGTYDAAGNVREWMWNTVGDDGRLRYVLGGSWRDPTYLYTYGVVESPWDRADVNGVRLVGYDEDMEQVEELLQPVPLPAVETISPVSDSIFEVYRDQLDYDPAPLNANVDSVDRSNSYWTRETVSFDATYDNERVMAHVFLPRNVEPPYQVVVYYPSSDAIHYRSSDELEIDMVDFIVKSGRAVVIPVLWGTYERNIDLDTTWPKETREYSNNVVRWIQDFRRTVDYLETRPDMNLDKLGFYGFSWGGWNGPIVLALDSRFDTGVFLSGGIPPTLARPEASSASYATRVTQPVLMISGKDDVIRPVETYQAPMFESLGTPDHLKRHAILEGGHLPPIEMINSETLQWYDRHLGPVE